MTTHPIRLLALLLSLCSLSFAADRYTDAGFPAADREWTAADYTKAAALLQEKKIPLPTARNDESSALLRRMTNPLNLEYLQDKQRPALARYQTVRELEKALSTILAAYANEAENGAELDTEIDYLIAIRLYLIRHAVLIVEELIPQQKKDGSYEANKESLKKLREGIARQFSRVEELLDEKYASTQRSYIVLLTAAYDSLSVAKRALKDDVRTDLQLRFQKRLEEFQNPKSRELLQGIIRELTPEPEFFRQLQMSPPSIWP